MQDTQLSQISNFIWGVADDLLRDVYVRGKYRDVILPMTVLRRLDAVLEPTKQKVLDEKKWADDAGIENQAPILEDAAGQSFYNTSPFGLKDLTSRVPWLYAGASGHRASCTPRAPGTCFFVGRTRPDFASWLLSGQGQVRSAVSVLWPWGLLS